METRIELIDNGKEIEVVSPLDHDSTTNILAVALANQFKECPWLVIRSFFVELERQTRGIAFQSQQDRKAGRELTGPELKQLAAAAISRGESIP